MVFRAFVAFLCFQFFVNTGMGQPHAGFADSIRHAHNIPALSYAVVTSDSILEIVATGYQSIDLPDTSTLDDRFHIASNTKAMTAFLIANYVEKGKLKWDTKFFDLFPAWKKTSRPEYVDITLSDLLSHRAGIAAYQGDGDPDPPTTKGNLQKKREAFGKFVLTLDRFQLDSNVRFLYSNAGYTLAALMLEKVTKKSWEQLMTDLYNDQLNLDIGFSWPDNQTQSGTWGHTWELNNFFPVASDEPSALPLIEPAGDVNIRLKDFVKFIQLQLKGLKGRDEYLKSATYQFLHKGLPEYAMGWYNIDTDKEDVSAHSGTAGSYYTIANIDRRSGIALIVFTNSFHDETRNGVRLLLKKLRTDYNR